MTDLVRRTIPGALVKQLGDRVMLMKLSTEDPDYTRDVIPLSAWKTLPARAPVLWSHQHDALPLGYVEPYLQRDALYGRVTFAPKGLSPLADQVHDLVKAGILTDCSVGFRPEHPQRNEHGGYTYGGAHLMELSIVSIGANPAARVVEASAGAAIRTWLAERSVPLRTPVTTTTVTGLSTRSAPEYAPGRPPVASAGCAPGEIRIHVGDLGAVDTLATAWRSGIMPRMAPQLRGDRELGDLPVSEKELNQLIRDSIRRELDHWKRRLRDGAS